VRAPTDGNTHHESCSVTGILNRPAATLATDPEGKLGIRHQEAKATFITRCAVAAKPCATKEGARTRKPAIRYRTEQFMVYMYTVVYSNKTMDTPPPRKFVYAPSGRVSHPWNYALRPTGCEGPPRHRHARRRVGVALGPQVVRNAARTADPRGTPGKGSSAA